MTVEIVRKINTFQRNKRWSNPVLHTNEPHTPLLIMARKDNRKPDQLRPISILPDFTPSPFGSIRVSFGNTQVWCSASVEDRQPNWMRNDPQHRSSGWITAQYSMLPGSTSPRSPREGVDRKPSGRTLEIQRLIGRALRSVCNLEELGPRTIHVDCEVLNADGGTRTASITGAYVATAITMDHLLKQGLIKKNPLQTSIAAVSCGIIRGQALLDLDYSEDFAADVDMNVVMTRGGRFVEIQGASEKNTFDDQHLSDMLSIAKKGISEISLLQEQVLASLPK